MPSTHATSQHCLSGIPLYWCNVTKSTVIPNPTHQLTDRGQIPIVWLKNPADIRLLYDEVGKRVMQVKIQHMIH